MQCRGFDPHLGRGVVSLSKTLHPHCFKVLVKPRKPSQNDYKKLLTWTLSLKQTKKIPWVLCGLLNLIFYCGHFQIQCFSCLHGLSQEMFHCIFDPEAHVFPGGAGTAQWLTHSLATRDRIPVSACCRVVVARPRSVVFPWFSGFLHHV